MFSRSLVHRYDPTDTSAEIIKAAYIKLDKNNDKNSLRQKLLNTLKQSV
jgi:hypothetical protein